MNHPRPGALLLLLAALAAMGCMLQSSGVSGAGGAGGIGETTSPTVNATVPDGAATDVAVGATVDVIFSEAMAPSTLTGATFTLTHGGASTSGAVTYSGVTATFTPTIALALNTVYTATITTGAEDLAGNALVTGHAWSFTTRAVADTPPPTVTSTSPPDGALDVAAGAVIGATFSVAMDPATISAATFTVTNQGAPLAGAVTYAGATASFAPEAPLAVDGSFLATVSTGATDLAGNALAAPYSWSFSTRQRPTVTATSPAAGAQGAAINGVVTATFSVAMDPATISAATFLVSQGGAPVSGAVSYLGTTATFTPTVDDAPNTTLTATITTGAKDLSGDALGQDHVWTFQTGASATLPPVALGVASTFAVLAANMVANTASAGTLVTGDLGISPGTSLTGFPPGVVTGGTYTGAAAAPAQADLLAAYNDAAGRPGGCRPTSPGSPSPRASTAR